MNIKQLRKILSLVTDNSCCLFQIDLQNIKDVYKMVYQKSLREAVSKETSGDFKKLLLGIIGE